MTRSALAWVAATDVTRAYLAEDYEEALRITDALLERFPDRLASFRQLRAEVLVRLGRPDDARASAATVLDSGRWWSDRQVGSLEDEGLDLGNVGAALRSRGQEAVDAARTARAHVEVHEAAQPWVTVVALHMYGVPAAETLEVWLPVVAKGVNVVAVESTLTDGDGFPCWDKRDLALRDLGDAVAAAPPDVPLVLAGASQGAGLAASAALNGEARADGWLAVVGAPQPGVAQMERLVPGALVVGADDPLVAANQRTFRDALVAAGGHASWHEVAGLSHDYPPDWGDRAPAVLREVLSRDRGRGPAAAVRARGSSTP